MDSNYDEFGNYIGAPLDAETDSDTSAANHFHEHYQWHAQWENDAQPVAPDPYQQHQHHPQHVAAEPRALNPSNASLVPALVPSLFPSASAVYGAATDVVFGAVDGQSIDVPIIAPRTVHRTALTEARLPRCAWDWQFLADLQRCPTLIRHVCVIGHLQHGKTSLVDQCVAGTHDLRRVDRYTDGRLDERARGMSLQATPISFVLQTLAPKSFLVNLFDAPGHPDFTDELAAAIRASDCAIVVVDAAEGVQFQTARAIEMAVHAGLTLTLVLSKVDRLILELKLPPSDAYAKLAHTIDHVNAIASRAGYSKSITPTDGSVAFSSAKEHGNFCFSLESFARCYCKHRTLRVNPRALARRLWGSVYRKRDGSFESCPSEDQERTFVELVLTPIYKVFAHVLGAEAEPLHRCLHACGIVLSSAELQREPRQLLPLALNRWLGDTQTLASLIAAHAPPADDSQHLRAKLQRLYSGAVDTPPCLSMMACDSAAPLMADVFKLYARADSDCFDAFARIYSGELRVGDAVRVLGQGFTTADREDEERRKITKLWIYQGGRYRVEVDAVPAGNWALIAGLDGAVNKAVTIAAIDGADDPEIFRWERHAPAVLKVSLAPSNPSDLPKLVHGLRVLDNSCPSAGTAVEASGDHVLAGPGELFLDCALHALRDHFSRIEVKVTEPTVLFNETVTEQSHRAAKAVTTNQQNELTVIAEPLDADLVADLERGTLRFDTAEQRAAAHERLERVYGWDELSAARVLAVGPPHRPTNLLVDATLSDETDRVRLASVRDALVSGFQWTVREGPLADEPVRACQFSLLRATLSDRERHRSRGQIIPATRAALLEAFMLARPALMEPVLVVAIQCPPECLTIIASLLQRRRGHIRASQPVSGTPLFAVTAALPALDAFGFEVDLRVATQGAAAGLLMFDRFERVPGDPLDAALTLRPLEPAPRDQLARDCLVKTRRRKGLSHEPTLAQSYHSRMTGTGYR